MTLGKTLKLKLPEFDCSWCNKEIAFNHKNA